MPLKTKRIALKYLDFPKVTCCVGKHEYYNAEYFNVMK